jgi:hypothetical protein
MNFPLRLHTSQELRPALQYNSVTAPKVSCSPFSQKIVTSLRTQAQQCYAPVLRETLQQLCDEFYHDPQACLPKGIQLPETVMQQTDQTVDRFTTILKQHALYLLDLKLVRDISEVVPKEIAKLVLQSLQNEAQLHVLDILYSRYNDAPFLQTCLKEHQAASREQKSKADMLLVLARLPILTKHLEVELAKLEEARQADVCSLKETLSGEIHQAMKAIIADNEAQIVLLRKQQDSAETRWQMAIETRNTLLEQQTTIFEQQQKVLEEINNTLVNGVLPTILPEGLPAGFQKSLATTTLYSFLKRQPELKMRLEQTEAVLSGTSIDPELQKVRDSIDLLSNNIRQVETERHRIFTIAEQSNNLQDLVLRIKRLFGRGKDGKTRAESRDMLEKYDLMLRQSDAKRTVLINLEAARHQQLTQLAKELATELTHLDAESVIQREQLKIQLVDYLRDITLEYEHLQKNTHDDYQIIRERCVNEEETKSRQVDELNLQLLQLRKPSGVDMLGSVGFPVLCDKLAGHPSLKHIKRLHEQLTQQQGSTSSDITVLKAMVTRSRNLLRNVELLGPKTYENEMVDLKAELSTHGFDIISIPVEIRQTLAQSASLFIQRCVEKTLAHPLYQQNKKAETLAPRVLEQLAVLASRLGLDSSRTLSTQQQEVSEKITGLRRIVSHEHSQALTCAADFTAQYYLPENDIYLDRQWAHGTCVVHSWNNLLSYLTDNCQMMLTPWRIEKWVQSVVTLTAYQQLDGLLKNIETMRLSAVGAVLSQIIRTSDLVLPVSLEHFKQQGHIMTYNGNPPRNIERNNLWTGSQAVFDAVGVESYLLTGCTFGADITSEQQAQQLSLLARKNYDAFNFSLHGSTSGIGHALCLLRDGAEYLLVDSNYDDTVRLTLPALAHFITHGGSGSEMLDETLNARNYREYTLMILRNGFYRGENH